MFDSAYMVDENLVFISYGLDLWSIDSYVTTTYVIHLYYYYMFLGHVHNRDVSDNR